jgi:hypothetical protein
MKDYLMERLKHSQSLEIDDEITRLTNKDLISPPTKDNIEIEMIPMQS